MKRIILVILLLIVSFNSIYSQQVKVQSSIDTNKILIGDQINYSIKIFPKQNEVVIFPLIKDSLGNFLVVRVTKIDTLIENKNKTLTQKITLTSFDSGIYVIPGLEFGFIEGSDTNYFTTDSYKVEIHTLPVDTTKPIKDIKPIMDVPFAFLDYFWYIVGFFLLLAAGFGAYYLISKWKPKVKEYLPYDPKIPAHVQALKDLNELERQKLWQKGQIKEYYIRLSDILRLYLERRFGFLAMESTTSEIMDYFLQYISSSEITKQLREVLELSDLVKFAKLIPSPEENSKMLEFARNIVQSTIPIENEENQK